jgi:Na+-transporting methylmalonyl-CoA/oxaloacetate decarboxylase gamma subunit
MSTALPIALSTLGVVLIVLGVIVLIFFIGGVIAVVTRSRRQAGTYAEHVAAADSALEQARAADKGWHRDTMEEAARAAIAESRPGWDYSQLHLVFVDDRPGVTEDRAHFVAVGADGESRVILARQDDRWIAERVE